MGVLLAINHRSSGVVGAVLALAVIALIIGVEVPWLLRRQQRKQADRLRNLPDGAFYAGLASTRLPSRRGLVQGALRFEVQGASFAPLRGDRTASEIPWTSVARLRLRPAPGQPFAALLVLALSDGTERSFIVRGYSDLARILLSMP